MKDVTLSPSSQTREVSALLNTKPGIQYWVEMPQPESHLIEVTLRVNLGVVYQIPPQELSLLDLKMPVWTPGSYLVREYARHLQDFHAFTTGEHHSLVWRKVSKNQWQIETEGASEITVKYRIFANELTVRTNHLDATHCYFNSAALFFYLPECLHQPIEITIEPPDPGWLVSTALTRISEIDNTFLAPDFDTLVDSPFEIGNHQLYEFEVRGKSHQLALWGRGNVDPTRLRLDIEKIIEVEAELFGGLPYDKYLFLLHLSSSGFGGLEHKFCCSLNYPRFGFRSPEKYERFLQLVAHEFFHLWNVKRIRPKALEIFNYEGENYTPSLWFSEGSTSYYDLVIPYRCGILKGKDFLNGLSKEITRLQTIHGRFVQPVSESSWDAWIKLYRRDSNSDNCQISYYLKGELITFLLDLLIRSRHKNNRSFDDVMRRMWEDFGKSEIGFTPEQLQRIIESVAEVDLRDFFARYIDGTEELPFDEYLEPFGLQIQADDPHETAFLGLTVHRENGREIIKFVEAESPAQEAGIDAGDELLALDGFRVNAEQLSDRVREYKAGDTVEITIFHHDELINCAVTLGNPRPTRYQIVKLPQVTTKQQKNFMGWLGASLNAIL